MEMDRLLQNVAPAQRTDALLRQHADQKDDQKDGKGRAGEGNVGGHIIGADLHRGGKAVSYTHLDVYKRQASTCPWKRSGRLGASS